MSKVLKFIRGIEKKTAAASILIFLLMLVTKLLGFLKFRTIAQFFGVSKELDVFWAAFAIPDLIFTLLIAGTVNAALIPVFIKTKEKEGHKKNLEVLNSVINFNVIIWLFLGLLLFLSAPLIYKLFIFLGKYNIFQTTTSYEHSAYDILLFIKLTRLMFISPFILGISSIFSAFLNAYKRFTAASLAPLFYNVGILLGIYTLQTINPAGGIFNLAYSIIIGSILHLIVQLPAVWSLGYVPSLVLKFSKYVKEILFLAIPRILGLAVEQIAITFDTFWALILGAGALSIFKYASSIHLMPVHLFTNSILQVTFPNLNENAAKNGKSEPFVKLFLKILIYILWITSFTAILIIVLKIPIIKVILGTGKFKDREVFITSLVLASLSGAIVFYSLSSLIIRAFYALHETKKPFLTSLVGVFANIIFAVLFSNFFSHTQVIEVLKTIWISRFTKIYWPFDISDTLHFFTTRSSSLYSVVGLGFGITISLLIEVIFSLYLLNKEVALVKTLKKSKTKVKVLTIFFANIIVFIVALNFYSYLNQNLPYSTKNALIEIVLVSLVAGFIYSILTLPIYIHLIRRLKIK